MQQTLLKLSALLLITCILYSCANVIAPDGGAKDTTPPALLSIDPADSQLNLKPKKIVARFDKFMEVKDLQQNMTISPMLDIPPTVIAYGKRVEITLVDSLLRPNTTYKINFGKALTDNREYTPIENFTYFFSTGSFFDSLSMSGQVINALTGLPDTSVTIMLYDATLEDSLIQFKKPIYVAKVNEYGSFSIDRLPNLDFKLFAIQDVDNNYLYSPGAEKIAFWHKVVNPSTDSKLDGVLYTFTEEDSVGAAKLRELEQAAIGTKKRRMQESATNKKQELAYSVVADTSNTTNRTFDIKHPLWVKLLMDSLTINTEQIYLSYDANGIDAEAITEVVQVGDSVQIKTQWLEDKLYTLRLIKGWAKDSKGNDLLPGKYSFRTKSKQDYSELKVNFPDSLWQQNYIAIIKSDKDTVYYDALKPTITIPYLSPNNYSIFIFKDLDGNKKWTTGAYQSKRLPELMLPHDGTILLRAGWDNEIDFKPFNYSQKINSTKPTMGVAPDKE